MKKKPPRRDILSCEGDRRRAQCWEAVGEIERIIKAIRLRHCHLSDKAISILTLCAAAMGEITERG